VETIVGKVPYPERRKKSRIICDYPAVLQGREVDGTKFSENGRVINLSASGIFVVSKHAIPIDTEVNTRIALPTGSLVWGTSKLSTSGNVVRNELQTGEAVGIAINFHRYKFL